VLEQTLSLWRPSAGSCTVSSQSFARSWVCRVPSDWHRGCPALLCSPVLALFQLSFVAQAQAGLHLVGEKRRGIRGRTSGPGESREGPRTSGDATPEVKVESRRSAPESSVSIDEARGIFVILLLMRLSFRLSAKRQNDAQLQLKLGLVYHAGQGC